MKIEFKTVFGELLFEGDFSSIKDALVAAVAEKKDLRGANLADANLGGANLGDALKKMIAIPRINSRILKAIEQGGELDMKTWHRCETTHCRAGWAIHLIGEKGRLMESLLGAPMAGTLIYAASDPDNPIPNFYAGNEDALKDLKDRAAKETASSS